MYLLLISELIGCMFSEWGEGGGEDGDLYKEKEFQNVQIRTYVKCLG